MKLAIMQPYFFPYLGYFALIKHTDKWVVFDTPQFIRHGWIERNRILKPKEDWQYINVPLKKHNKEIAIRDLEIRNDEEWQKKMLAQIAHYKKTAPNYSKVKFLLESVFSFKTNSIVDLDVYALEKTCEYLNIDFNYSIFSKSNLQIGDVKKPDEWALEISKSLKATEYYNPPGGEDFFDKKKYLDNNIGLNFLKIDLKEYSQKRNNFIAGLSIIDVMMFNSPEEINEMLNQFKLI